MEHHSVIVIGGGISGLATAWWLHKAGHDVVLLEREEKVGGTMRTTRENGWLIETGPNSALETTPLFKTLFADLHLENEVVYANENSEHRYILKNGSLHPLPMSPVTFLRSTLWSTRGKLRLLKEPFIGRANHEETIAEFVTRRLGKEFLDYAINPFVAGVYAGNPEQLSVRAAFPKLYALEEKHGGLIKGQIQGARERRRRPEKAKDRARLFSFLNGIEVFPQTLSKFLGPKVQSGVEIETISIKTSDRLAEVHSGSHSLCFEINGNKNGRRVQFSSTAVVFAIPAYAVAELLRPLDSTLAGLLSKIYYPPVAEVFLGFREEHIGIPLDGFGFLVPAKERRNILGTIWSSAIFPHRAPAGFAALTTFVGGSRQPEILDMNDEKLAALVTGELRSIMNINGEPNYVRVTRWRRAIPQYHLGHLSIIQQVEQFEKEHPGFFLAGNFRGGIAVGDCVMSSEKISGRVSEYLKRSSQ
ncbi:MAG: protoporphyrinogen oxidase [Bacteroidota bacterium]|nr:protoporphyrinogen oxidase [Bacteroidota bacterium]